MQLSRLYRNIAAALGTGLLFSACYKDKGNYTYHYPQEPQIANLDTVYNVLVGDSLVIKPTIQAAPADSITLVWNIASRDNTNIIDTAKELHIIFGLGAERYRTTLTVINKTNGMKYFHYFYINGQTAFATGTTVLTEENGASQLSFIKPNGDVQARVFAAVNPNTSLPGNPLQLVKLVEYTQNPVVTRSYWVLGKSGPHKGYEIDVNTFKVKQSLENNFFDVPDSVVPGAFCNHTQGVLMGVINGQLYGGTTSTWDQSPTYGMFGLGTPGDYNLSPQYIFNSDAHGSQMYVIGFDTKHSQFVRFNSYGGFVFFGPAYGVVGSAFNPLNLGMELVHMEQVNGGNCYAFCKAADGSITELKFSVEFNGPFTFTPAYQRSFMRQDLVLPTTKWVATSNEVFYFSSNDKIYRYNPLNLDLRQLNTGFKGNNITMLKVLDDGTLAAGTNGSLYYLNITGASNGDLITQIDGLPGNVVDLVQR